MHKKDFLQRQFEEFGKVLAMILRLKRDQDWDKYEAEIAAATKKYTGREILEIENLSEDEFQSQITSDKLSHDQKKIIAALLFEKLNFYLAASDGVNYDKLKVPDVIPASSIQFYGEPI
jgi:hypothetical protein